MLRIGTNVRETREMDAPYVLPQAGYGDFDVRLRWAEGHGRMPGGIDGDSWKA